jgi:hypothetical protein
LSPSKTKPWARIAESATSESASWACFARPIDPGPRFASFEDIERPHATETESNAKATMPMALDASQ